MTLTELRATSEPCSPTCGIQEAIDALGEAGGVVIVPAGQHVLRRAIRLRNRVTLRGEGQATILTRPAPVFADLTEDTADGDLTVRVASTDGFKVGDQIRLMDDKQPMYHSRELLIEAVEPDHLHCTLVYGDTKRIYRATDHAWIGNLFPAVTAMNATGVTIESLAIDAGNYPHHAERSGDFLGAGIHTFQCHDLRIRDVTVRRWPADGISVQDGSANVTGCMVEDCQGSGLHPGTRLNPSVWIGNIARRNRDGFFFCSTVRNTVAAHNVLIENRRHGIWGLGDPDMGNVVVGNVSALNGAHGLEAARAWGNVIAANLFRANSGAEPGRHAAMMLKDHRYNLVAANLCMDDQDKPTQTTGISSDQPRGDNCVDHNAFFAAEPPQPGDAPQTSRGREG